MMRRAGRVHGLRGLTVATVLILIALGAYDLNGRVNARILRYKLLGSPLSDVPAVIAELKPYRRWVYPLLSEAYDKADKARDPQKQLNAALALLPVDETKLPYLKERLLHADAQNIAAMCRSPSSS